MNVAQGYEIRAAVMVMGTVNLMGIVNLVHAENYGLVCKSNEYKTLSTLCCNLCA